MAARSQRVQVVSLALAASLALGAGLVGGRETAPVLAGPPPVVATSPSPIGSAAAGARVRALYALLPLSFERNEGQGGRPTTFLSRGSGYSVSLDPAGATVSLARSRVAATHPLAPASVLRYGLVGANPHARMAGVHPLPGTANYFEGSNPRLWRTRVPTYARVAYHRVYPGVDLVYYGTNGQLEYDFLLAPGADPHLIRVDVRGAGRIHLDARGDLVLATGGGTVYQRRPLIYQQVGGRRRAVAGHFVLLGPHTIGFAVGRYDTRRPLVIDPVLVYSTYFSGGSANVTAIALGGDGSLYLTGSTGGGLPTVNPLQPNIGGGLCPTTPCPDVFLTKLNPQGTALLFSTYLGGSGSDVANGIAVDRAGNAYLTGSTTSTNFPVTPHAVQAKNGGGNDVFVAKISANGSKLLYGTYVGGATDNAGTVGDDVGTGIAVDRTGAAYVTGSTYAYNFPLKYPIQKVLGNGRGTLGQQVDAFVFKLNPQGSAFVYSTYFGGSGSDFGQFIAVDRSNNVYLAGYTNSPDFPIPPHALQGTPGSGSSTPFVSKLNARGSAVVYSTYLGTTGGDKIHGMAIDSVDNLYLVGETTGGVPKTVGVVQPISGGGVDTFVTKLSARGVVVYSTYLGGSGNDYGNAVAVDGAGNAYVAGSTDSASFNTPIFPLRHALQGSLGGNRGGFGMTDAFIAKVNSCGTALLYSSYLGGTFADAANAIAVDRAGTASVVGTTLSPNFPLHHPLPSTFNPQGQSFIAKISAPLNSPSGRSCPPPLILNFAATTASPAQPLTVTVQTAPGARIAATLVITQTPPAAGQPAPAGTPKPGTVLYRARVQGVANGFGEYRAVLRVRYKTAAAVPAQVTVRALTPGGRAVTSALVTITP